MRVDIEGKYWGSHVVSPLERTEMDRSGLSVVNAGHQHSRPRHQVGPRIIDMYDLVFVVSGKGRFWSEVHETPLRRGLLVLLFPNVLHAYTSDPNQPLETGYVAFTGRDAVDVVEHKLQLTPQRPVVELGHQLSPMMDIVTALIAAFEGNRPLDGVWRSRSLLWGLLGRILALRADTSSAPDDPIAATLRNLFETDYAHDWKLADLARLVHLSPSRLYARFKKETGHSPLAELTEVRLKRAASLLSNTDLTVGEVAASVGIHDAAYFSRLFRKHKGVPPSSFKLKRSHLQTTRREA